MRRRTPYIDRNTLHYPSVYACKLPAGFSITLHPTGTLFNTSHHAEARA